MSKHTPGPWKEEIDDVMQAASVRDASNRGVCHVAGMTFDERKANAALIAAAPDMLAELRTLLRVHERKVHNKLSRGDWQASAVAQAHVDRIAALIARASGEP